MSGLDFLSEELNLIRQESKMPVVYSGIVEGYYTVVELNEYGRNTNSFTVKIGAIIPNYENNQKKYQIIEDLIGQYASIHIEVEPNLIVISDDLSMHRKVAKEELFGVITSTVSKLQELGIQSGDFLNGDQDESISLYQVDNSYQYLSQNSFHTLKEQREIQNKETDSANHSITAGMGGAIIGALVGAILWGVLLYFGYYGWFAAIIGIQLAFYLYKRNGGSLTIRKIIIVTVFVIISLIISNYVTYVFIMYELFRSFGVTLGSVFWSLMPLLQEIQAMNTFILDLVLGVGIATIFAGIYAYRLYNESKNENTIRQID